MTAFQALYDVYDHVMSDDGGGSKSTKIGKDNNL